jgi:hypothetical protein
VDEYGAAFVTDMALYESEHYQDLIYDIETTSTRNSNCVIPYFKWDNPLVQLDTLKDKHYYLYGLDVSVLGDTQVFMKIYIDTYNQFITTIEALKNLPLCYEPQDEETAHILELWFGECYGRA